MKDALSKSSKFVKLKDMKAHNIDGARMREIAKHISEQLPGLGFTLLIFDFGNETNMSNYISNANREDMIKALEEMVGVLKNHKDFRTPEGN